MKYGKPYVARPTPKPQCLPHPPAANCTAVHWAVVDDRNQRVMFETQTWLEAIQAIEEMTTEIHA